MSQIIKPPSIKRKPSLSKREDIRQTLKFFREYSSILNHSVLLPVLIKFLKGKQYARMYIFFLTLWNEYDREKKFIKDKNNPGKWILCPDVDIINNLLIGSSTIARGFSIMREKELLGCNSFGMPQARYIKFEKLHMKKFVAIFKDNNISQNYFKQKSQKVNKKEDSQTNEKPS